MILRTGAATLALGLAGVAPMGCAEIGSNRTKKVLFFSKSAGFEHSVIKTTNGQPGLVQKLLAEEGPKHGIEFTFSKDGSLFTPQYLEQFDALYFHTTGDLTTAGGDGNPGMTPAGKQAFLDAVSNGKGFIASHCASDTFHTIEDAAHPDGSRNKNFGEKADPYIRMLGGEFLTHGKQQKSTMRVVDTAFPGIPKADFGFTEEWYSLKDFAPDLHVILVQETEGMEGDIYHRASYPATWARKHGKGRVFYTSMGHRDDVWTNPTFQSVLFGGIAWAVRNVSASIPPNMAEVTPKALELHAA